MIVLDESLMFDLVLRLLVFIFGVEVDVLWCFLFSCM